MHEVGLRAAQARLSTFIASAEKGEPSTIVRNGKPVAVIVGFAEWQRLSRVPSFGRLLMNACIEPGDLPERDGRGLRPTTLPA